jgi:hypothetical protein
MEKTILQTPLYRNLQNSDAEFYSFESGLVIRLLGLQRPTNNNETPNVLFHFIRLFLECWLHPSYSSFLVQYNIISAHFILSFLSHSFFFFFGHIKFVSEVDILFAQAVLLQRKISGEVLTHKFHNVSETGSVSVLRWMGQDKPTQLGPLERASLNHWTMDRVQNKPNSSVQHTLSSESFQVYTI